MSPRRSSYSACAFAESLPWISQVSSNFIWPELATAAAISTTQNPMAIHGCRALPRASPDGENLDNISNTPLSTMSLSVSSVRVGQVPRDRGADRCASVPSTETSTPPKGGVVLLCGARGYVEPAAPLRVSAATWSDSELVKETKAPMG